MASVVDDSLDLGQQKPLDAKQYNNLQPYANIAEVNSLIPISKRYKGLTVDIVDPDNINNVVEYWYQGGIANVNLIEKLPDFTVPTNTSDLINDGEDGSSPYVTDADVDLVVGDLITSLQTSLVEAQYDSATKIFTFTRRDGSTFTRDLSGLESLPEVVVSNINPVGSPSTGQKVYFNSTSGQYWINASGTWVLGSSVTVGKEFKDYENLFNKDAAGAVTTGVILTNTGTTTSSANGAVTGFIEIPASRDIYIMKQWYGTVATPGTPLEYAYYDTTNTFISYHTAPTTLMPPGGKIGTSPANAKYIRFNIANTTSPGGVVNAATFMVYVGNSVLSIYSPYKDYISTINNTPIYEDTVYTDNLTYNEERNRNLSYNLPVNALREDSYLDNNTPATAYNLGRWGIRRERNVTATKADGYIEIVALGTGTNSNGGLLYSNFFKASDIGKQVWIEFEAKLISGNNNWRVVAQTNSPKDVYLTSSFVKQKLEFTIGADTYNDQRLVIYQNGNSASTIQIKNFKVFFVNPEGGIADSNYNPEYNVGYVPNAQSKMLQLLSGTSTVWNIGFGSDSWSQSVPGALNYVRDIKRTLQGRYGNGGGGYYDFSRSGSTDFMRSADDADANDVRTGTITYVDQTSAALGVNVAHPVFTNGSGLTLNITTPHTALEIYYRTDPTFGTFTYSLDGGAAVPVNTNPATGFAKITLSGLSDTTHTLVFSVTSGNCIILGVNMMRASGVRVHKLGNRGLKASDIVNMSAAAYQDNLTALALDTYSILLGTNEKTADLPPTDFYSQMQIVINRAKTALPYVDIALLAPSNNKLTNAYPMIDYERQLFKLAVLNNTSYLSLEPLFGSTAQIIANGSFVDDNHPSAFGGNMIANYIFENQYNIVKNLSNLTGGSKLPKVINTSSTGYSSGTYTVQPTDKNWWLVFDFSIAVNIQFTNVNTALGDEWECTSIGTGQMSITAGSGATMVKGSTFNAKTLERYSTFGVKKYDTTVFTVFGSLEPAITEDVKHSEGVLTVAANTTVLATDIGTNGGLVVYVSASAASRVITLPAASTWSNKYIIVRKTDASANTVTVNADVLPATQGAYRTYRSDGTTIHIFD